MREIKFRAKTTVKDEDVAFNNEWVEGDLIFSRRKPYIHPKANAVNVKGELGKIIVMHEVQVETVCQYTGLKDKNGTEIYEGDIISYGFRNENEKGIVRFGTHENVSSKNQGFYVEWTNKWCSYRQDLGYFANIFEASVIGNIFDNPELLNNTDKQAGEYADNEVLKSAT